MRNAQIKTNYPIVVSGRSTVDDRVPVLDDMVIDELVVDDHVVEILYFAS